MWIRTIALALLIGAPLASYADPVLFSPDGAIETSTETLSGPLVEGGMLLAKSCIACQSEVLRLDAQTQFLIGKQPVTVAELNKFLQGGGTHGLGIFYDKKSGTVSRFVVFVSPRQQPDNTRS